MHWIKCGLFKLQGKCSVVCSRLMQMKVVVVVVLVADGVVVGWSGWRQNRRGWNEALLLTNVVPVLVVVAVAEQLLLLQLLVVVMDTGIVVEHAVP